MERYEFGTRVAQLRKMKGITQAQLAEMLNVSNKTISRWETGDGYPDISLLKPLAIALGVSIDYLLGNENDENNGTKIHSDECGTQNERTAPVVRDKPFDWRHPRWRDLTPLNKVAAATLMCSIVINIVWWLVIIITRGDGSFFSNTVLTILVFINVILLRFGAPAGAICAIVALVRGEKGLSYRQRKVSIWLVVLNVMIPMMSTFFSVLLNI